MSRYSHFFNHRRSVSEERRGSIDLERQIIWIVISYVCSTMVFRLTKGSTGESMSDRKKIGRSESKTIRLREDFQFK